MGERVSIFSSPSVSLKETVQWQRCIENRNIPQYGKPKNVRISIRLILALSFDLADINKNALAKRAFSLFPERIV